MARRIAAAVSAAWWAALTVAGLSPERWAALTPQRRKAVKAFVWLVIGLVVIAIWGVWETSAIAVAAVILLLVVPPYQQLRVRGFHVGKWITPAAALAIVVTYPY